MGRSLLPLFCYPLERETVKAVAYPVSFQTSQFPVQIADYATARPCYPGFCHCNRTASSTASSLSVLGPLSLLPHVGTIVPPSSRWSSISPCTFRLGGVGL